MMNYHEARYYDQRSDGTVQCFLCPHECVIKQEERGICGVRENHDGRLYTLAYGRAVAVHSDPIEKKPLFHVIPGSISLSIGTVGCNFRCLYCQNYDISQYSKEHKDIPGKEISAQQIADEALHASAQTVAFTYNEPTVFTEWAEDIARVVTNRGLRCVSITNGFISPRALRDLAPYLLAANVDLKSFRDEFYRKVCGARLQPVLDTIKLMRELGIWVEVTTLLIPGMNDSEEELTEMAKFLASLDPDMPWHISRFHPDNKMRDFPSTPMSSIDRARSIGKDAGVRFIYSGNVWGDQGEHTRCPACNKVIIERFGFNVVSNRLQEGMCPYCKEEIKGIWS